MSEEKIVVRQKAAMTEEEFFAFVQNEVGKIRKHTEFEAKHDVSFFELQEKLMEYTPIYLSLIELQARYRYQVNRLEQDFQMWFDDLFIDMRSSVNRPDLSAQKWAGQKELEAMVRVRHMGEYFKKKDEIDGIKHRESVINSLLKAWETHKYVLSDMCKNVQSEVGMAGMGNALNH